MSMSAQQLEEADEKTIEVEIKAIEKRYMDIKNKMKKVKNDELSRIGKEFMLNHYQNRFKVQ
jgi:hypothetical protein